ncbi:AAA family ATPase [Ruania suaedae]|uniref:AAA family ATPase n=1 Tax=Ruania suaedae TaxID=2897774 RepID=UPI001E5BDE10|nr:MoxR family ATPase [Ruania suaedae]UFU02185.1 AAA family ATPase [Ruania suaedae]
MTVPPAAPGSDSPDHRPAHEQPQDGPPPYGQPAQGRPDDAQPQEGTQPHGYQQPQGYGRQQENSQPQEYSQPQGYGQPQSYAPQQGQQGYAPVEHERRREPEPESEEQRRIRSALADVRTEVAKSVVGQDAAVTGLVIALLCRGHVLLEGVPGVAKTLLTRTLGATLELEMKRVQFTPDLMPGDVTGSLVYDARTAEFSFREGPVFTNLMLADEINRTPPKTQASLLEAMEERQVSVDGDPRPLPDPFMVIATQNPVEYEGTYPLPEAQLDRFLLKLLLPLPERTDEIEVLNRHAHKFDPRDLAGAGVGKVAGPADLEAARADVANVEVGPQVLAYIVDVCRATRTSPSLSLGVSPRGATALLATARAWAWMSGRRYVTPDDVKALAHPTLRHRVQLRAEAELEGITAESVLDGILGSVPVPR